MSTLHTTLLVFIGSLQSIYRDTSHLQAATFVSYNSSTLLGPAGLRGVLLLFTRFVFNILFTELNILKNKAVFSKNIIISMYTTQIL